MKNSQLNAISYYYQRQKRKKVEEIEKLACFNDEMRKLKSKYNEVSLKKYNKYMKEHKIGFYEIFK